MPRHKKRKKFLQRHKIIKFVVLVFAIIIIVIIGLISFYLIKTHLDQSKLQPFYSTSGLNPNGKLGEVVRQEPLNLPLNNGSGIRVIYRTQKSDNSYTFSSGMIFIPNNSNAGLPRPVVAWAHGTLGFGDECAPSRLSNPISSVSWVDNMLAKGWIVTATDYAGFGTPGIQGYLVGQAESNDVINSVRAAQNIREAKAGNNYAIWGHSQGGNSALFAANNSSTYDQNLNLLGVVASAPAAELVPLLNEQYGSVADWVIGPLVGVSWPSINTGLSNSQIMTSSGFNNYKRIANQCILQSALVGLIRNAIGIKFLSTNLTTVPNWRDMATKQSAPIISSKIPLYVVESKTDQVVLPNTTALYIEESCKESKNVETLWLNNVAHQNIPKATSQQVITWLGQRFSKKQVTSTCGDKLPIAPAIMQ
jgi:alpha-beta hydrolase superfamily lysophospholipase